MSELKCLYEIGKSTEKTDTLDQFIEKIIRIIPQNLNSKGEVQVGITLRDKNYGREEQLQDRNRLSEPIIIAGEVAGSLDVAYPSLYQWDKKSNHFIKTLAERIAGAIHNIELEQSLEVYYEQLEMMVEKRTRELEQAQEKLVRSERLAAVGELASGVGHELRNPLNVIRNCAYLINMSLEGRSTPEIEESLKLLDIQVDISDKIVGELLDYTRVKPPVRNIVNLNSMVRDRLAWASVPEKVKVQVSLCENEGQLFVDPEQVGRAVTNIINNAIQSVGSQGELQIATGIDENWGWIKISDNGCGIAPENLSKIFEPLFTTKTKGIGLGLAICKRMIDQNQGEILVESAVGQGSTFTLKLPLTKQEATQNEIASQYTCCR
jgi:signal transduction histidine kinase